MAYISGLGTFSLSKGIITEKGMAGRLISLVTNAALPPTPGLTPALMSTASSAVPVPGAVPWGPLSQSGAWRQGRLTGPARTTQGRWPGASPPATAAASARWASPVRNRRPPPGTGQGVRGAKEPGEGSPGSFCMGLLFQLAGGGGGEVGVDESVHLSVHDGANIA